MLTMRHRRLVGRLLGSCAALLSAAPLAAQGRADAPVAIVDVTVIPMDRERTLPGQTVVVRDGRIAEIGPSTRVRAPGGARVVDGRGKFLIPGLAEMHAHIPTPQGGAEAIDRTLFLYLAGGVTTVRGMLGHPHHLELRARAERGEILSPRIYTSGPSANGNSTPTPEAATRLVEEQKAAGYDFVKLHPGIPLAAYEALAAAGKRVGLPYAGHVPAAVGLRRALEAGQATIDHLDAYAEAMAGMEGSYDAQASGLFGINLGSRLDTSRIPALAAATRAARVWNVPTQTLMEHLASREDPEAMARRPEMRYMPAATLAQWVETTRRFRSAPGYTPESGRRYLQARRQLIKALHDGGAGLLLGSDAPQWWNVPGFSIRRELRAMVDAGLTPYQALATGTRNPAVFFGALERAGTVEKGKVADLVLLDANPLQDIDNVWKQAGVMVRGRWLPQAEIERRLAEIEKAVR